MTLSNPQSRRRFGQTIIANFVGCALLIIGFFTTPLLMALGFAVLVVSFVTRSYVLVTARRRRSQRAQH
jgi:energy-converting hydrogenase Eha subunit F